MFSDAKPSMIQSPQPKSFAASTFKIYSKLFNGLNFYEDHDEFWIQIFNTPVDYELFMKFAHDISTQQFISMQTTWNLLLLKALDASLADQDVMEVNALDVLIVYFKVLFKWHASDSSFVVAFSDWDSIESFLARITRVIIAKLTSHNNPFIRKKVLFLFNILIVDSPLDNIFSDYFISRSELLMALLNFGTDPATSVMGPKAMICLSLLMNYKRYETKNLIYLELAQLNDTKICNQLASFFMENFWKARMAYEVGMNENKLKESQKEKNQKFWYIKGQKTCFALLLRFCIHQ